MVKLDDQSHPGKFDQLKKNMQATYQEKGRQWVSSLPAIVDALRDDWKLTHIIPVNNMSYHFVAKAKTESNELVVLKVGVDEKSIEGEKNALAFFDSQGCVRLLNHHPKYNALLLEQAIPGHSLHSFYPNQWEFVVNAYCAMIKKLHNRYLPLHHSFPHIKEWLTAIDNAKLPTELIKKAILLKNNLLASMAKEIVLHGDLHHDNVIQRGEEWISIDPKGVIGEPEFEVAAFDFMNVSELSQQQNVREMIEARVKWIAQQSNLNEQRIRDWIFVRLLLMAAWLIEDNGDPTLPINLARILYTHRL